jgi:DNA polymerase-3 subunit delta
MTRSVYALVGDDNYLQLQALAQVLNKLPADVQRADFDGERAELADVLDELRSFAMFGAAKLVVVRAGDEFLTRFRDQLEDYVTSPSSSGTLVLRLSSLPKNQRIYKAIAKVGEIIECIPPRERDLPKWVASHAKAAHRITLAPDAVALLIDLVGADLGRLDNELAKLALTCDNSKKPLTASEVTGCVAFQREQEIREMTIELASGRPGEALRRWRQLAALDSSAEFRAVTWIMMWLEDVGTVLSGRGIGNLGWKYRDRMDQFLDFARTLGKSGHARAIDRLAEIDKQTKSGVGDAVSNVERFILSLS